MIQGNLQIDVRWNELLFIVIGILGVYLIYVHHAKKNSIEGFDISGPSNMNRISIWKEVKNKHGEKIAKKIMPMTYLFPNEVNRLIQDPSNQFILKTYRGKNGYIGQRTGVELYDDKKKILRDHKEYVLGQVFIKNPYLINGHKFDIRFFLVIYCGIGNLLYLPGYCVYANKKFKYEGLDRRSKINQVNSDERHYDINRLPRSFFEMCKHISPENKKLIIERLARNLRLIVTSVKTLCYPGNKDFHIYGVDIELTDDMEPLVIEINQSPSLRFDIPWKHHLITPMMNDIRTRNFKSSNWIKL